MKECDRQEQVEDLVLGLLGAAEARGVADHVALCASCSEAEASFILERSLFELRAEALPPPPSLELSALDCGPPRATLLGLHIAIGRTTSAFVAVAACAAALFGIRATSGPTSDCAERGAETALESTTTVASPLSEEALACGAPAPFRSAKIDEALFSSSVEPASTHSRRATRASETSPILVSHRETAGLACVADRVTCDEPD